MPPPDHFVMSTGVTGPRGERRPAGVLHAVAFTLPPTHTTLCGRSHGLYLFAHLDFRESAGRRCRTCCEVLGEPPVGRSGERRDEHRDRRRDGRRMEGNAERCERS